MPAEFFCEGHWKKPVHELKKGWSTFPEHDAKLKQMRHLRFHKHPEPDVLHKTKTAKHTHGERENVGTKKKKIWSLAFFPQLATISAQQISQT